MNLNIFNNIEKLRKKSEEAHELLEELKNKMEDENNIGILEEFQSNNKVSIGTKNQMERRLDDILLNYANETGEIFFIVEKLQEENAFVVYKYEESDDSVLKLTKEELPEGANVNTVLRMQDGIYAIDENATEELRTRITDMANELLEEQNKVLEEYRKEGHLYRVSENINGSIFIYDITDNPSIEVEEVDFPEELKEEAQEGRIFEYTDGSYILKE